MFRLLLFYFIVQSTSLFGQPEGLTKERIQSLEIKKVSAFLDMESDNPIFENLEVRVFEFDENSNCIREKYLYPFFDVVTTSNESLSEFDSYGNLVRRTFIHKTEPLTEQGKEYVGLFGETNDTTIYTARYDEFSRLIFKSEIEEGDTLTTEFFYRDSLKVKSRHYNNAKRGGLNRQNYSIEYTYDDLGRVVTTRSTPATLTQHSTTRNTYLGDTDFLLESETSNDFEWVGSYFKKLKVSVSQDSVKRLKTIYEYDNAQNLIKQTTYRSFPNVESDFYGTDYKYQDKLLVEEQSFNTSEDVINLRDKIIYVYDSRGLLVEERMIYENELKYRYRFVYE